MSRPQPRMSGLLPLLVVAGIALVVAAGAWRWLGRPTDTEVRTAEVSCAMLHPGEDELCEGRVPKAPTTGPIVVAVAGGVLLLFGVILASGGRERVVYVDRPEPPTP